MQDSPFLFSAFPYTIINIIRGKRENRLRLQSVRSGVCQVGGALSGMWRVEHLQGDDCASEFTE